MERLNLFFSSVRRGAYLFLIMIKIIVMMIIYFNDIDNDEDIYRGGPNSLESALKCGSFTFD